MSSTLAAAAGGGGGIKVDVVRLLRSAAKIFLGMLGRRTVPTSSSSSLLRTRR